MKLLWAGAIALGTLSCHTFPPGADGGRPLSREEEPATRERLRQIGAAFRAEPLFYEIPPGAQVDIDALRLTVLPRADRNTAGSALAEVDTLTFRGPDGTEITIPRLKQITLRLAEERLEGGAAPSWERDATLAHELGHAFFAARYPLIYVKSGDFNLIEGHAVTVQWRWTQRHHPEISEEEFLRRRTPSYRNAYLRFQRDFVRDSHTNWALLERKEMDLRSGK